MHTNADPDDRRHRLAAANLALPGPIASSKKNRVPAPPLGVDVPTPGGTEEARHPGFHRDGRRVSSGWGVERHDFAVCPICLSPGQLTLEHVPMKSLGGKVMTTTCKDCNNKLGAKAEEALRGLIAGEVTLEATSPNADGPRGVRRATAAIRQVPFAPPTFHVTSGDSKLLEAVRAGVPMELRYHLLDRYPAGVAILKYAYLAACIWLEEIPQSGQAVAFREALVAARDGQVTDADLRASIGSLVHEVAVVENVSGQNGSVILVEPTEVEPRWTFILGSRLAVPWPFADLQPSERNGAAPRVVGIPSR